MMASATAERRQTTTCREYSYTTKMRSKRNYTLFSPSAAKNKNRYFYYSSRSERPPLSSVLCPLSFLSSNRHCSGMRKYYSTILLFLLFVLLLVEEARAFVPLGRSVRLATAHQQQDQRPPPRKTNLFPWSPRRSSSESSSSSPSAAVAISQLASGASTIVEASFTKALSILTTAAQFVVYHLQELSGPQRLLLLSAFVLGVCVGRIRPFWVRWVDAQSIPAVMFGPSAPFLPGRAVSVSDGDTIRFLHTPTPWSPRKLSQGDTMSKVALPVRICTM